MGKVLLISTCKEKLHELEFVSPIEDILKKNKTNYFVRNYLVVGEKDLQKADRVIICGTSLKDNAFAKTWKKFCWIKDFDKPILGICAGMQLIGMIFDGKIRNKTEIGFYHENFKKEFLGLSGENEVYHLHNNYVDFDLKEFDVFCESGGIAQAVKHKNKKIFGVLFHPEVRNKKMILNFVWS